MQRAQIKTMRDVFIENIYNKMYENEDIFFLSDDFGAPSLDKLREKFKDRFINVGIAEQNLINISTGLALEGFIVYVYAIAPFLTMRAYEQIKLNLSLLSHVKEININLIGVGAGLSYDISGATHHCLEDISIMRVLPQIIIFSPSDWRLVEGFVDLSINIKKPKYLRFDGKPVCQIYPSMKAYDLEKGFCEIVKGEKVCITATGYMTHTALKAKKELSRENIDVGVIDVFFLKPINIDLLYNAIKNYKYIITIEEGFINKGGLDTIIANILMNKKEDIQLIRMGFDDTYVLEVGNRIHLHKKYGLDKENIVKTVHQCI